MAEIHPSTLNKAISRHFSTSGRSIPTKTVNTIDRCGKKTQPANVDGKYSKLTTQEMTQNQ
eukprot:3427274-Ditylum_brightwellii.AAC.1